ncbi:methyltransferase domain-containing protein [Candidatus Woesearchaeota archaeon]|nr:methyltransferase domain-containing protein [Candidatus Woesearchaeota archaeon]MBT6023381.1 methyltransferase domain-containing protein [Candidatus Woesearchaeota archaeon]
MEQQKYSSKHLNYNSENNEKYREDNYQFIKKHYSGEPSSAKVLDIGCGEGRFAYLLYDLFEEWHGIDSSSKQIKQARLERRNYQKQIRKGKDIPGISREAPVRRIFFKEGAAEKVPHAEGKFDIIVYFVTWNFIKNPEKAVKEVLRVLRDGGLLVIIEPGQISEGWINPKWNSSDLENFNEKAWEQKLQELKNAERFLNGITSLKRMEKLKKKSVTLWAFIKPE